MENFAVFWEALVPLYCLYYGYSLKKNPPKLGENGGVGGKIAMQSKEAWDYANAFGCKLFFIIGAVTGALFILRLVLFGMVINLTYSICLIVIELICIIGIVPLVNMQVKKKFGKGK